MDYTNNSGANSSALEERHQTSGLNSRFNEWQPSFADYVAHQRKMIAVIHADTNAAKLKKIVNGNAPFELYPASNYQQGKSKPYKRGIMLIHGLSDSPYFMRYLAKFFSENGFRVMAILLPGHGTRPGDLLDVQWQEWVKAVAYGTDRLSAEVDEIYLAGYSAGATLSIYHSLHDPRVNGLFLFSPAFKISPMAAWAHIHNIYSWLIPSGSWISIMPDRDLYKYESFPKNGAAQMHALTQEINKTKLSQQLKLPVFAAASADDTTVDPSATLDFMLHTPHPCSKLVYYTSHQGKLDRYFPKHRMERIYSVVPSQNILSSAHTAILLPSADPHYGVRGDYSNCTHYYPDEMQKYEACFSRPTEVMQGEITTQNLAAWTLRRLMYNPHYAELETAIKKFIEELP